MERARYIRALTVGGALAVVAGAVMHGLATAYLVSIGEVSPDHAAQRAMALPVERFARAEVFAMPRDPATGIESENLVAFRRLLREPNAPRSFEKMILEGTGAGKLYGLCGLGATDAVAFARAVRSLAGSPEEVRIMMGCEVETHKLGRVAARENQLYPEGHRLCDEWK